MVRTSKLELKEQFSDLREEATRLAGKPSDLVQRSSVYYHMYQHSKGNHAFPLLAAHGALWGSKHFARGLKIGRALSISMIAKTGMKKQRMAALERFAMAFKEINRQVCVETYTCYHMTRLHGEHPDIAEFIPVDLVESLNSCHQATRKGTTLSDVEKRTLFAAFFYWEQDNIVGPGVDAAVSMMDWPVIMFLAMKPAVGFQYFNNTKWLWFSDFANKEERIDKGLQAFELAESAGWNYVEQSLGSYKIMPEQFLMDPARHFEAIKRKSLCF